MNIIILDPFSAVPQYTLPLCEALSKKVSKVILIGNNNLKTENEEEGGNLKNIPFLHPILDNPLPKKLYILQNLVRVIMYPFALIRLYFLVINHKIDVIHFQWSYIPILEGLFVFFLKDKCKFIYTIHNSTQNHGEKNIIKDFLNIGFTFFLKKLNKVIVHTNYSKKVIAKKFLTLSNKIEVVPHGLNTFIKENLKYQSQANSSRVKILFFGQISYYKGVDVLIKSLKFLTSDLFEVHICGRPELSIENLKNLAKSEGVVDKLFFKIRYLSDQEVDKLFFESDIIVFPYRHIDQSSVLMGSLRYGKSIVASNVGGFAEILKHNSNALLFDSEDESQLGNLLDKLVSSKEKRKKLGKASLALYDNWPSWENIATETVSIYRKG